MTSESTSVTIRQPYNQMKDDQNSEDDVSCKDVAKAICVFAPSVITLALSLGAFMSDPESTAYSVCYAGTWVGAAAGSSSYAYVARTTRCQNKTANIVVGIGMALTITAVILVIFSNQ